MYRNCLVEQNFDYVDESICLILKTTLTLLWPLYCPLFGTTYFIELRCSLQRYKTRKRTNPNYTQFGKTICYCVKVYDIHIRELNFYLINCPNIKYHNQNKIEILKLWTLIVFLFMVIVFRLNAIIIRCIGNIVNNKSKIDCCI